MTEFRLEDAFRHKLIKFIPYTELENLTRVDSGKFGSIQTAYWHKLRKTVAVKRLYSFEQNDAASQMFVHELKIQKRVEYHDRIIRVLGVSQDPSNKDYMLILQYAEGGSLRSYLAQKHSMLTWNDRLKIAYGIADALKCLHDEDIVHCDLHSKNILIDNGEPKIADFGISRSLNSVTSLDNGVFGMIPYIEPKRFANPNYPHDKASDMYSLGVILWEISSGQSPFKDLQHDATLALSICDGLRETPVVGTPQEYTLLYQQCWHLTPRTRPSIDGVFQSLERMIIQAKSSKQDIEEVSSSVMSTMPPDQQVKEIDQNIRCSLTVLDNVEFLAYYVDNSDSVSTKQSLKFQESHEIDITSEAKPPTNSKSQKIDVISMAGSPTNSQSQKIDIISISGSPINSPVLLPASSTNNDQESQNHGFIKVSSPRKSRKIDGDKINVKVVVVGDGAVGKTALLGTYVRGSYPMVYDPTVFENFVMDFKVDGESVVVDFWDTCGQEDFDRIRAFSYPDADAVIIAFAADGPASLDNVYGKWTDEVRHHLPKVPIFLVATKTDMRDYARNDARIEVMTYEDGSAVAKNIKAAGYLECSAKTGEGLDNVFEHVIRAGVLHNLSKKRKKRWSCNKCITI